MTWVICLDIEANHEEKERVVIVKRVLIIVFEATEQRN